MLAKKIKDIKIRQKVYNTEINKTISKFLFISLLSNKKLSFKLKKRVLVFLINSVNKRYSKTKVVRRCWLTNRARVSDRKTGISRIKLKEMLKAGIVPGYQKALW
jgi:ribosomal protein S14